MTRPQKTMAALVSASILLVSCLTPPVPSMLVLQLNETFEDVARGSTYPVQQRSTLPANDPVVRSGVIWVTKPAVIIRYDDPVNGFTLPPTKFAGVLFMHNRVQSIETSPMLDALPFWETVKIFKRLQDQFRDKGWMPNSENYANTWIDLSAEGMRKLHDSIFGTGMNGSISLGVPKKNLDVMLRMKCFDNCDKQDADKALFLIDVGVGAKSLNHWNGE